MIDLKMALVKGLEDLKKRQSDSPVSVAEFIEAINRLHLDLKKLISETEIKEVIQNVPFNFFGKQITVPGMQLIGPNNSVFQVWPVINPSPMNPSATKFILIIASNPAMDTSVFPNQYGYDLNKKLWFAPVGAVFIGTAPSFYEHEIISEKLQKAAVFVFTGQQI